MNLEEALLTQLAQHANAAHAKHAVSYHKSSFPILGCSMPALRSIATHTWDDAAKNRSHSRIRTIATKTWKATNSHEVMTICLLYFSNRKSENTLADWRVLKTWAQKIDNWAHSDMLSDIYADLFDRHRELYDTFQTWNANRHPWKRRLSLTSLYYYSSMRKNPLSAKRVLPLVRARLHDEHFYVQRAVGWTLRECGNLHPKPTEAFVQKYVHDLSSIAFTTATERWQKQKKNPLLKHRKDARKRQSAN